MVCGATQALGEDKFRVRIDSSPPGAKVYIDDKAEGAVGTTPYLGRIGSGSRVIILELNGYETMVRDIRVRRRTKRQRFRFAMKKIGGATIKVTAPKRKRIANAVVRLNGEKVGTLPTTLRVPPGPHQIEVIAEGYEPFEQWVELDKGDNKTVVAEMIGSGDAKNAVKVSDDPPDPPITKSTSQKTDDPATREDADIAKQSMDDDKASQQPWIEASAGAEVTWRRFKYQDPQGALLRPYSASGFVMFRADIYGFPLARLKNRWLRGIGASLSAGISAPLESALEDQGETVEVDTTSHELDAGIHARFPIYRGWQVGADVAYGQKSFRFSDVSELTTVAPEVRYRYARFGIATGYRMGRIAADGSFNYLQLFSGGRLEDRFGGTKISGLGARGAISVRVVSNWFARLGVNYSRYAYDFDRDETAEFTADGGTDQFFGIDLGFGYRY